MFSITTPFSDIQIVCTNCP